MNPSPQNKPSRRTVLKSIGATTTLAASGLLPSMIYAAPSASANDKLRVGLIGAGNRAKWLTRALSRESHRAELVAVCDCYLPQIDVLAADNKNDPKAGDSWKRYQNYEQMFEQEDLDAVMIATPDHVRVRAAIIACAKGLDVYAEKPLSFSIPEGRALVKAVRKHKRVLQVGTQQRSTPINQYCLRVRARRWPGQSRTRSSSRTTQALGLLPASTSKPFPKAWIGIDFVTRQRCSIITNSFTVGGGISTPSREDPFAIVVSHALDMVHLADGLGECRANADRTDHGSERITGIAV